MSRHLEQIIRVYSSDFQPLYAELDQTLGPRGPDFLHKVAARYLTPKSFILDIGCRDAKHLIQLVRGHGTRGAGVDPVPDNVDRAIQAVREAELTDRIEIIRGVVESLAWPDETFDFVWCRDVLGVVENLAQGLREMRRVLAQDGHILIYESFETDLMEPRESAALHGPLGNVPANQNEGKVEDLFIAAGLTVEIKDVIGTEWREYEEERTQPVSRNLLRLARLRRRRDEIVQRFGEDVYLMEEASLQWLPCLLLGKLKPVIYVLRRGD